MSSNLPSVNGPFPLVQAALDFLEADRAVQAAREVYKGGITWLEAGTPLIKSEGINVVSTIRKNFPQAIIIADMKTMDAGRIEVEAAAKAGANIVVCLAAASDATIVDCVEAGKKYGVKIYCDTIGIENPAARAIEVEKLGVDFIGVHCPIDEQMHGKNPVDALKSVAKVVNVPVAVAGGVTSETAASMVEAGASIIIAGGALSKAKDGVVAARDLVKAVSECVVVKADFGSRGTSDADIREMLLMASASNLSDAMNHRESLRGIFCRTPGKRLRMVGKATTVQSVSGDWSKVVQAIDIAGKGGVVVADCGGGTPAVWGECATLSSKAVGLAGVVINGAVRDTDAALELGLPIFSNTVSADAGEPKGYGEINCEIRIGGQRIMPGDWIVGDDDGVVVLPQDVAAEYANKAVAVMEAEARLKSDILDGKGTLTTLANLARWEKQ